MNLNVYNESGALKDLLEILRDKSIHKFNSVDEIIEFKKNYNNKIEDHKSKIQNDIIEEIKILENNNKDFHKKLDKQKEESNLFINNKINRLNAILGGQSNNIFIIIRKYFSKRKLNYIHKNIDRILYKSLKIYLSKIEKLECRIEYLTNNQDEEINIRAKSFVAEMEYIVSELNALAPLIYGSFGEAKAINALQKLPNQYYIINDFRREFNPPLYNRSEDERIFSTQIDHIVVGPTGIYVIETKYWSKKSIESNTLFSPIKQLRRGGFAFYIIINDIIKSNKPKIFSNNWGQNKISVSNILLMMNLSTKEQFQYVKILTEDSIINYIINRPVIFNEEQIEYIVKNIV